MVQIINSVGIRERTELWKLKGWGSIAGENGTWLGIWRVVSLGYKDAPGKKRESLKSGFCWENGWGIKWIHWAGLVILWTGQVKLEVSEQSWWEMCLRRNGLVISSRNLLLTVLGAGNLRLGCQHGWVRTLFQIADLSLYPHIVEGV